MNEGAEFDAYTEKMFGVLEDIVEKWLDKNGVDKPSELAEKLLKGYTKFDLAMLLSIIVGSQAQATLMEECDKDIMYA